MKDIKIPTLTCLRCGHKWHPRTDKLPAVCPNPKCKSPYWNKPRKGKKKIDAADVIIPPIQGPIKMDKVVLIEDNDSKDPKPSTIDIGPEAIDRKSA